MGVIKKTGVLLLHGFGGSPKETDYLAKKLMDFGCNVYSPTIAGHGRTSKELANTNANDWIQSAQMALDEIKNKHEKVIVIGFSMGGLIGTHLALSNNIEKLVLINSPVWFWNFPVIIHDFLIPRQGYFYCLKKYKEYMFNSRMKSCFDFVRLMKSTRNLFSKIKLPTLILQCTGDETTKPKSADFINNKISNSKILKFNGGRHQVFQDGLDVRDEACEEILRFIKS